MVVTMFGIPVNLDPDQLAAITTRLDQIVAQLKIGNGLEVQKMGILDDLEAEVGRQTDVETGIEKLIANFVDAISNAGTDRTRLQAVLTALRNNDERLAKLITDNTPADAPAEPTPPQDTSGLQTS
jgi:hypothetical protein